MKKNREAKGIGVKKGGREKYWLGVETPENCTFVTLNLFKDFTDYKSYSQIGKMLKYA